MKSDRYAVAAPASARAGEAALAANQQATSPWESAWNKTSGTATWR